MSDGEFALRLVTISEGVPRGANRPCQVEKEGFATYCRSEVEKPGQVIRATGAKP